MIANTNSVGPNPTRSSVRSDVAGLGFFALTSTFSEVSWSVSWLVFQNDGTCVANSVVGVAFSSFAGPRIFSLNVPLIAPLVEEIDETLPALSCWRKYGLNGTVTRGCPTGWLTSTSTQLTASNSRKNSQKPRRRCGGVGLCSSGIPRPSGAGATRQPRRSRGIAGDGGPGFWSFGEVWEAGRCSATTLILSRYDDRA